LFDATQILRYDNIHMNVTELARRLGITPSKLRQIIPQLGFDIGAKAIKIDQKMAQVIIDKLSDSKTREKYLDGKVETNAASAVFIGRKEKSEENAQTKSIKIPEKIMVKELAKRMGLPVTVLIAELMHNGVMASINQDIDFETAAIIAEDMGFIASRSEEYFDHNIDDSTKKILKEVRINGIARPPVIVVMGHVDHGKTKLLDAVRETNIVDSEAGGITQHIGAYQVDKDSRSLTFIDTPGHEAFSAMRSRGAQVADIAILVVAADDGVRPQTIEAISHIKQAELPFIVAINKIDKPEANVEKIKSDLANIDLTPEDWGGKTITVPISAKEKINISDLLDTLFLVADMHQDEIVANPKDKALGTIIESNIDIGQGPVATVLIQNGTLKLGDYVRIGDFLSKVRVMKNWKGEKVSEAVPSMPISILGLKNVPQVGDILHVIQDKREIRQSKRSKDKRNYQSGRALSGQTKKQVEDDHSEERKNIKIILKADVLGSIGAILESLEKIKNEDEDINIQIVKRGLGNITEKDVEQAAGQDAYLIGFGVGVSREAGNLAASANIDIRLFTVIYDLLNMLKKEADRIRGIKKVQFLIGKLKILVIFRTEKKIQIVGGEVIEGKIISNSLCRIIRGNEILGETKAIEIESGKEKVKEVDLSQQCGVKIAGNVEARQGDIIEFYHEEEINNKSAVSS